MNNDKVASIFAKQRLLGFLKAWAIPLFGILLVLFLVYEGYVTNEKYQEYVALTKEKDNLEALLRSYKSNKLLPKSEIETYGVILAGQVPIKDDIYSLFGFIEELKKDTGFDVGTYVMTKDTVAGTQAVASVTFSMNGDTTEKKFSEFLNKYSSYYSRYMVMKSMTKSVGNTETVRDRVTFDGSFQLISIPTIENLAKSTDGTGVKLLSFDKILASQYETIRAKINPVLLNVVKKDVEDIPTEYPVNSSLF